MEKCNAYLKVLETWRNLKQVEDGNREKKEKVLVGLHKDGKTKWYEVAQNRKIWQNRKQIQWVDNG